MPKTIKQKKLNLKEKKNGVQSRNFLIYESILANDSSKCLSG